MQSVLVFDEHSSADDNMLKDILYMMIVHADAAVGCCGSDG